LVLTELPERLIHRGNIFCITDRYIGDADYLRDSDNRLIGFSYILGELTTDERQWYEALVQRGWDVRLHDGMLLVFLEKPQSFAIECVQAIGTTVHVGPRNEFMLAVPDWGFGKLASSLTAG
jgi:hypothetical protein